MSDHRQHNSDPVGDYLGSNFAVEALGPAADIPATITQTESIQPQDKRNYDFPELLRQLQVEAARPNSLQTESLLIRFRDRIHGEGVPAYALGTATIREPWYPNASARVFSRFDTTMPARSAAVWEVMDGETAAADGITRAVIRIGYDPDIANQESHATQLVFVRENDGRFVLASNEFDINTFSVSSYTIATAYGIL